MRSNLPRRGVDLSDGRRAFALARRQFSDVSAALIWMQHYGNTVPVRGAASLDTQELRSCPRRPGWNWGPPPELVAEEMGYPTTATGLLQMATCNLKPETAEDSLHSTSLLLAHAHIGGWIHREQSSATEQTGSGPHTNPCRGMESPSSESTICPSPRIGACCRMVRSDQATKHVARVKEEPPACLTITAVTALGRWREPFSSERDVSSIDQEKE